MSEPAESCKHLAGDLVEHLAEHHEGKTRMATAGGAAGEV
jgi:hypothetical protein